LGDRRNIERKEIRLDILKIEKFNEEREREEGN